MRNLDALVHPLAKNFDPGMKLNYQNQSNKTHMVQLLGSLSHSFIGFPHLL